MVEPSLYLCKTTNIRNFTKISLTSRIALGRIEVLVFSRPTEFEVVPNKGWSRSIYTLSECPFMV